MRHPVHLAMIGGKTRPVVVLTREAVRKTRQLLTVVPVTSTVWGISGVVAVGEVNGLDRDSVVNGDNIQTVPASDVGEFVGFLTDAQEIEVRAAILAVYDL